MISRCMRETKRTPCSFWTVCTGTGYRACAIIFSVCTTWKKAKQRWQHKTPECHSKKGNADWPIRTRRLPSPPPFHMPLTWHSGTEVVTSGQFRQGILLKICNRTGSMGSEAGQAFILGQKLYRIDKIRIISSNSGHRYFIFCNCVI
jgi:hypothetical protein